MSDRKITIKIDEKYLLDVIEELKIAKTKRRIWKPKEIFLTLDLPDTKSTYEYLAKSPKISDWSLGEYKEFEAGHEDIPEVVNPSPAPREEDAEIIEEVEDHPATVLKKRRDAEIKESRKKQKKEEPKNEEETLDKFTKHVLNITKLSDNIFNGLAVFIEASWRVCRKSPGVVFGTPLFTSALDDVIKDIRDNNTVERALLQKVIESYYNGIQTIDMIQDLRDKIQNKWKLLSQSESLTNVSIMIFRNV